MVPQVKEVINSRNNGLFWTTPPHSFAMGPTVAILQVVWTAGWGPGRTLVNLLGRTGRSFQIKI